MNQSPEGPFKGISGLTRAELLRRAAVLGVGLGAADLLAACGGSSSSTSATSGGASSSATPKAGALRVGMESGGNTETFNPALGVVPIDAARAFNTFDGLIWVGPDNKPQPRLALEWNSNADATQWQIKLRPGVTWHDGKPFTADDVIYTLRGWGSPANYAHSSSIGMNLKDLKKVSDTELMVPLLIPNARLMDQFGYFNQMMVQDGSTPKSFSKPIGTGPFKVQSFTPGQRSMSIKNENYWMSGKPYADSLEIISIADPSARLNALKAGQIDIMNGMSFQDAKAEASTPTITILNSPTPTFYTTYMNTQQAPFNDVRVRQAMMWAVNRQELVDSALVGFGTVGNDMAGKGLPLFNTTLPQKEQDIEKAKSLLKAAGHDTINVSLHTSPIFAGFVESATLMAQQVAPAGIKISIKQEQPATYLVPAPAGVWLKELFAQDKWPATSLQSYYTQALVSQSPYPETHWTDPSFDALLADAIAETDEAKAQDKWNAVQEIQYTKGGNIIWAQPNNVDATSSKVVGITPGGPFEIGGFAFWDAGFSS